MQAEDLENRFSFHPANTDERANAHRQVRDMSLTFAEFLNSALPEGREKSLAMTKLEEVMFWGNAAIARQAD
jgi:hypothetical protein